MNILLISKWTRSPDLREGRSALNTHRHVQVNPGCKMQREGVS